MKWLQNYMWNRSQERFVGEEQHCAYFKTLCLHPDYASSHIDKIFVNKHAHRMLSSSILCVMTSTDNNYY